MAATYEEGEHEEEGETFFTVGGEYERHLTRALGIGVEFEYVADADAWLFLAPITFHPAGGLKLFGARGCACRRCTAPRLRAVPSLR